MEEPWNGYDSNPYYNPEKCGLEIVGMIEDEPNWDFNMLVVWRHLESGVLYFGTDSGCSCPSPFENVTGLGSLTRIKTVRELSAFKRAVKEFGYSYRTTIDPVSKAELVTKVRAAL